MQLQNAANEMNHPPSITWVSLLQEVVVLLVLVGLLHLIF